MRSTIAHFSGQKTVPGACQGDGGVGTLRACQGDGGTDTPACVTAPRHPVTSDRSKVERKTRPLFQSGTQDPSPVPRAALLESLQRVLEDTNLGDGLLGLYELRRTVHERLV